MRKYYNYIYLSVVAVVTLISTSACEKWLDIVPQTQIESDVAFEKESGFQDALTGVYLKISDQSLYGRELTFGMVDGLAGQFDVAANSNQYYPIVNYQYNGEAFISKNNTLYEKGYNAIANLNNLIANLDKKGEQLFSGVNYAIIKGEAYGLRAMLHFDLIRLYGSSIASEGSTKLAIPYVDVVTTQPQMRLTTQAFMERVLADLDVAAENLKKSDPIIVSNSNNATTYLRDRSYKLNYYAVKALQARAYLYTGNQQNALAAAKEVIDDNVFAWTPSAEIVHSNTGSRNRVYTQELVFCLSINGFSTYVNPYFEAVNLGGTLLGRRSSEYDNLFGGNSDYRYAHITEASADGSVRFSTKLYQPASMLSAFANRMPMIRKSELYYIAAECLAATDPLQAITYLNLVRRQRNSIPDLPTDLDVEDIDREIELEYRKEFISEGQLFYYYKRKNKSQIPDVTILMDDTKYVLPLPDREISYGL
ncbi:RagB/SusD family nutrient uptake outer membrane protein [Sphingobacterium alkalisoli]|uniref:RagB/SusD family nutrient uptake outer membrane protein n=1 Tax=Sphingobacterium alkalisoli TaxID=1874115 RepID=A0A4U0HAM1_9SPHI|nr:RagB/SusD family nutrient uptake outer membrane protein [Sphingobacterium alkalisoli]TJY68444.1 RagB/SusD family nutrient uptake outer membrane protein [Sphingobacterium alkalisoli]GGH06447.1 hypothetical protein GCM10011418_03150 [Sphingobacterium alkalisoli]